MPDSLLQLKMSARKRKSNLGPTPSKKFKDLELLNIKDAIKYLKDNGTVGKKLIKSSIMDSLKIISQNSHSVGLSPPEMIQVAEIISNANIGNDSRNKLLSCIIPSSVVPLEAVHIMLSFITSQKSTINVKGKIMDWMIAAFDFIQYKETLNQFYDLFFYLAQYSTLCRYACHLLFLITQKEDVKPFWVRRLNIIKSIMGGQPYIYGLLSIYQLYRPDLVTLQPQSTYKKFFAPSKTWTECIRKVQCSNASTLRQSLLECTQLKLDFVKDIHKEVQKSNKTKHGTKHEILPTMRSVNFDEDLQDKVPYQQINTFQQMVDNLHKLQLPSRIASILKYRALRMVVLSKSDPSIIPRLNSWIKATMLKELIFHKQDGGYEHREQLLGIFVELTDDIQEGIPCMEEVLGQYLMTWNGFEHRTKVLALISKWRICPFEQLRATLLDPLRRLYFRSSLFFKCAVLDCFTQMIHHMAMIELARYSCAAFRHHSSTGNKGVDLYFRSIFASSFHNQMDVLDMLDCLIKFVVNLADAGLRTHNYHPLLVHHVLCLYEKLNQLFPSFGIPKVVPLSKTLTYHALFSLDPTVLSRICSILSSANSTIKAINQSRFDVEKQVISNFLNDINNTVWNNTGFTPVSKKDSSQQISIYNGKCISKYGNIGIRKNKDKHTFSLFKHPALFNLSCKFLKQNEELEIEEMSKLSENKKKFVLFMQEKNFDGFSLLQQEYQEK